MTLALDGTIALVTGASSGIGEATARHLAGLGATVALVARRADRLEKLVAEIEGNGGAAFAVETDITDREQAIAAVERTVEKFGRLDIVVNNAGVMYLGPSVGADLDDWERMVEVNTLGMLYITNAALPHLLAAAEQEPRRVADLVNVSSVAGRQAFPVNGVYALTKFGMGGFTESVRQEVSKRHVRVGLIEPGSADTEIVSHNTPEVQEQILKPFFVDNEVLSADDVADAIGYMVTRPRHAAIFDLWISPTEQA